MDEMRWDGIGRGLDREWWSESKIWSDRKG